MLVAKKIVGASFVELVSSMFAMESSRPENVSLGLMLSGRPSFPIVSVISEGAILIRTEVLVFAAAAYTGSRQAMSAMKKKYFIAVILLVYSMRPQCVQ